MLSLYKGKTFHIWSSHKNHVNTTVLVKKKHNWTRGTLFLIASCLGYSFWFLAQVKIFFNHMIWLYINFIYFHVSLSIYIYFVDYIINNKMQAKLSTVFQAKYSATMLVGLFGGLQSLIVGISINREKSTWKLGWNLQLLTIFYSVI